VKRIIAGLALVFGLGGLFAFAAPSASAGPCVAIHVYVSGNPVIETGRPGICLPLT
jgi:hypothetical protein